LEEHYLDPEIFAHFGRPKMGLIDKLQDIAGIRIREMDAAGISMQVLSHAPPGLQKVEAEAAARLASAANDRLHAIVQSAPDRFAGFASLPTSDPQAAVEELERAVTRLGFKGAMIHGLAVGDLFLDDRRFWPIFERAQALDVPIYLHPADPLPAVKAAYYGDYATTHPMFMRAAWGFTFETGTHAMRLVLSGLFDAYPRLKIILGHLGETIPFLLARIDEALSRDTPMKNFREVFCSHFYVTTSGFFSDPALRCCVDEMGIDRVLFSVDWPYASNATASDWIANVPFSHEDKKKIMHSNAERLLRL
jgi:2,3-dihydroxybenzoate decarboxylase